jgi:hypothetical protein
LYRSTELTKTFHVQLHHSEEHYHALRRLPAQEPVGGKERVTELIGRRADHAITVLTFYQIDTDPPGLPGDLQERLAHNPAHANRRRYLAYSGDPVGLTAVDIEPNLFVYELYVSSPHRNQGVGKFMLERLCRDR